MYGPWLASGAEHPLEAQFLGAAITRALEISSVDLIVRDSYLVNGGLSSIRSGPRPLRALHPSALKYSSKGSPSVVYPGVKGPVQREGKALGLPLVCPRCCSNDGARYRGPSAPRQGSSPTAREPMPEGCRLCPVTRVWQLP